MSVLEDLLEYLVKGTVLIIVLSFAAVILAPFALGFAISIIFWRVIDAIHSTIFPKKEEPVYHPTEEDLKKLAERIEQEKQLAEEKERSEIERQSEEKEAGEETEREEKLEEEQPCLDKKLYLERKLKHEQREALFAQDYKRLKISPFGDSGAAYYWVNTRYNESKEHAFFCYILEAELKKYSKKVEMNVNKGPDLVVEHKGKRYCFDVETGKSLTRQPAFLEKKFAYYEREFDQSFIFVTNKSLKYKYAKYGLVITRGKLKETITKLFKK
jgi:hypothetical protein